VIQNNNIERFKFIDLFSGIGGFRIAMESFGGECVFSSEIDKNAILVYEKNFKEKPFGDITDPKTKDKIPSFDVLCAGFPCQPFSKGGHQKGFEDTRGTLFFDICEIVQKHNPKILLLENVANLVTHDKGNTYKVILKHLDELGYFFPNEPLILSPDEFGIPILRKRIFIPAIRKDIHNSNKVLNIKNYLSFKNNLKSIDKFLDLENRDKLSEYELKVLKIWNEFYQGIDLKVIGFPVIIEYFKFQDDISKFPKWKQNHIIKNQQLYQRNKNFIDKWLKKHNYLNELNPTHKKFEWQAGNFHNSLFEALIQFRPSGIRVKKSDKFSTFVAMNHQQIIGKLKRKIESNEAKKLLSFPDNFILHDNENIAFKHLGNSVSVLVVKEIFKFLKGFL
jgi:DNA (cytosine-5)-methyltransferase 1